MPRLAYVRLAEPCGAPAGNVRGKLVQLAHRPGYSSVAEHAPAGDENVAPELGTGRTDMAMLLVADQNRISVALVPGGSVTVNGEQPPEHAAPVQHADVTKWHVPSHVSVPAVKPRLAQVAPPRAVPSHASPTSRIPLPHAASAHVSPAHAPLAHGVEAVQWRHPPDPDVWHVRTDPPVHSVSPTTSQPTSCSQHWVESYMHDDVQVSVP